MGRDSSPWNSSALPFLLVLGLAGLGLLALFYFWYGLLRPDSLGALSLPLVACIAGAAATFNPCALPALPAFLALVSSGDPRRRPGRAIKSAAAGAGAIALVVLLGLLVAALGEGLRPLVRAQFRWVQLAAGLALVLLAGLHLLGRTAHLPLMSRVMDSGQRLWEYTLRHPTPGGSFLFGGGFVLVGVG